MTYQPPKGISGQYDDTQISQIINTQSYHDFLNANPQEYNVSNVQGVMDYETSLENWYQGNFTIGKLNLPKIAVLGGGGLALLFVIKMLKG